MEHIFEIINEISQTIDKETINKIKNILIIKLSIKYPKELERIINIIDEKYNIEDKNSEISDNKEDLDETGSSCGETNNELYEIINKNTYIKNSKSNKNKDIHSLSYLIDIPLSQSDCIKIGTGVEKVLIDIILNKNKELKNIKGKNIKGEKETDHLFIDETRKIIYYAELKSNLNLDTEKCKSTSQKCISILEKLQNKYTDYECKMYLVGLRYFSTDNISRTICKKYNNIPNNLVGINNYLLELNIDCLENEENYRRFINYISCKMFQK